MLPVTGVYDIVHTNVHIAQQNNSTHAIDGITELLLHITLCR
jgi:hypothetical protein